MKPDDQKELEKFAWEQLKATARDKERWSLRGRAKDALAAVPIAPGG
jgi:hypothetical protein